jgi:NADH-quinone oxidoreductase subunit J
VVAFVAFAAIAVLGALGTVAARNPIRAAVGLFFHILALAGLYLVLGAHFLGVIQLLVYAGAVVVLFVFVIMLLGPAADTPRDTRGLAPRVVSALCVAATAAMVVPQLGFIRMVMPTRPLAFGTLKQIGTYLFNDALIPFELIGVTLVVAVVGAFAVARGHHRKREALEPGASMTTLEQTHRPVVDVKARQTPGTEGHS